MPDASSSDSGAFRDKTREALFSRSPIGIAFVSKEWRWLEINPALCDLIGFTKAELVGRKMSLRDVTHPTDADAEVEELKRLEKGEIDEHRMSKTLLHKRGHGVPVDLVMSRVESPTGEHIHYIKFIQPARIDPKYLTFDGRNGDKVLRPFVPLWEFVKDHKVKIWGAVVTITGFIGASIYQHIQLQVEAEQLRKEVIEREAKLDETRRELDGLRRQLEMRRVIPPEGRE